MTQLLLLDYNNSYTKELNSLGDGLGASAELHSKGESCVYGLRATLAILCTYKELESAHLFTTLYLTPRSILINKIHLEKSQ